MDQRLQALAGDQKRVVAPLGLDFTETHIAPVFFKGFHDISGLVGRVKPVRGEGDHQEFGPRLGTGLDRRPVPVLLAQVEVVRRLGDVQKRIGIEAGREIV